MENKNSVLPKLMAIQTKLDAPKSQYNSFGKYHYRNVEDILGAVKPLLIETGTSLILSDTPVEIGGRVYIRATATIYDNATGDGFSAEAYAREPETKKGMDDSQITGAASSYARKYALGGLLLCDDNKDADTPAQEQKTQQAPPQAPQNQYWQQPPQQYYASR